MTKSMLQLAILIGIITTRLVAPVAAGTVEPADVETVDAHAYVSTPPARVDAIQQMGSSALSGVTFVRLVGGTCPGRSDGFFHRPQ